LKFLYTNNILRPAFTIIEVLISVIIISFSIIYVLKIHSNNHAEIIYLSERNNRALEDSLYLSTSILKYHKTTKTAYDLIKKDIRIKKFDSRELLKKYKREIFIPEEIEILPPPNIHGPTAILNEVKLKGKHSSTFWHFKIRSL
jgi:hypothetical protein